MITSLEKAVPYLIILWVRFNTTTKGIRISNEKFYWKEKWELTNRFYYNENSDYFQVCHIKRNGFRDPAFCLVPDFC